MAAMWNIRKIEVIDQDGMTGVVVNVRFALNDDSLGSVTSITGDVALAPPDAASFAALESVTEAQVLEWTKAALGDVDVAMWERILADRVAKRQAEQPRAVPLPWGGSSDA